MRTVYDDFYQSGSGLPHFMGVRYQRGHGLGNLLSGLFKASTPLLTKGVKSIGKTALRTGLQIAEDVAKKAAKRRLKRAGTELLGQAVSSLSDVPPGQRPNKRWRATLKSTSPKRTRRKATDIFS